MKPSLAGHSYAKNISARLICTAIALLTLAALSPAASAQATYAAVGPQPSRIDITLQGGYFHPFNSDINNFQYPTVPYGFVGSIAGYYNQYIGLQLEGTAFPNASDDTDCVYTAQAGPILRYQKGRFVPFFHALGGASKIGGPAEQPCSAWGWGVTGGFGVDYILKPFHNRLALHAQGDFQFAQIDNGPLVLPKGITGGFGEVYAWRPSAGITLRLGSIGPKGGDATLTCSADPASAFPGDPITVTSMTANFRPTKDVQYLWTTSGGKPSNADAITTIDTHDLAPGTYNVSGRLVEGRKQKEIATCATTFTIQSYAPPTATCSADKSSINSGDPVTITTQAMSPQNRPLTYTYAANEGQIQGNGATAALSTAGLTPGSITVTCNVADDKGQTASATTSVIIATPPAPPPMPQSKALCSISFDRDHRRPDRVDNEAKGCLDDIALNLTRDTAARLVLIGNHAEGETNRDAAARAMNAEDYLTHEKGIDATRIDLRIAADPTRTVNTMLIPSGAPTDTIPGSAFDTTTVVRKGQAYGIPGQPSTPHHKHHHHKAAPALTATP